MSASAAPPAARIPGREDGVSVLYANGAARRQHKNKGFPVFLTASSSASWHWGSSRSVLSPDSNGPPVSFCSPSSRTTSPRQRIVTSAALAQETASASLSPGSDWRVASPYKGGCPRCTARGCRCPRTRFGSFKEGRRARGSAAVLPSRHSTRRVRADDRHVLISFYLKEECRLF